MKLLICLLLITPVLSSAAVWKLKVLNYETKEEKVYRLTKDVFKVPDDFNATALS